MLTLGFKARVDSLTCLLHHLCTTDSSDSPLVWDLLTSWQSAQQPSRCDPHTTVQALVGLESVTDTTRALPNELCLFGLVYFSWFWFRKEDIKSLHLVTAKFIPSVNPPINIMVMFFRNLLVQKYSAVLDYVPSDIFNWLINRLVDTGHNWSLTSNGRLSQSKKTTLISYSHTHKSMSSGNNSEHK